MDHLLHIPYAQQRQLPRMDQLGRGPDKIKYITLDLISGECKDKKRRVVKICETLLI